jgi:hypothetical protein
MTWIRNNLLALIAIALAFPSGAYAAAHVAKNSVVSRSIKDGAVKARDLAPGSVGSVTVQDNSLTGADIDETTLRLAKGTETRLITGRLAPGTALSAVLSVNGLTVWVGCLDAQGLFRLQVDQENGVGIHERTDGDSFGYDMPLSGWVLTGGSSDYIGSGTYAYRRALDGASVWVDYSHDNSNQASPPPPLSNNDCVYALNVAYSVPSS